MQFTAAAAAAAWLLPAFCDAQEREWASDEKQSVRLPIRKRVVNTTRGTYVEGDAGFIDGTGRVVKEKLPRRYDQETLEALTPTVTDDNKWGFRDSLGNAIFEPKWDGVHGFRDGIASVCIDRKWALMDAHGQIIGDFQWEDASFPYVREGQHWGTVDRNGKVVVAPQWESYPFFREGLAPMRKGDRYGFVDLKGRWVIPPKFSGAEPFSEGLAIVTRNRFSKITAEYGYIDKTGELVIPYRRCDGVGDFHEGLAVFCDEQKEDRLRDEGRWGFIDRSGKVVIKPQWTEAHPFTQGLASVALGTRHGAVNHKGEVIIPVEFASRFLFRSGLSFAQKNGRYGLIDLHGKLVIPVEWDGAEDRLAGDSSGPVYRQFSKRLDEDRGVAVWLDPNLKEIWRAELPLVWR